MLHLGRTGSAYRSTLPKVIYQEAAWRQRPGRNDPPVTRDQVTVSRWTDSTTQRRIHTAKGEAGYHLLVIAMRPTEMIFKVSGQTTHSGRVRMGAFQISRPGQDVLGEFLAACDTLHLYLPDQLLSDCYRAMHGQEYPAIIELIDPNWAQDNAIEQLGRQLLAADQLEGPHGRLCADGLSLAIVARVLNAHANCAPVSVQAQSAGLSKWRLRRARDYIDANLGEPMHLSDIAASTGLSRMHFAAQFRRTTGMRPHEFVLRRRIERAQELISTPNATLVDVALSVGFQTQAHFTTVFKRMVGETPNRWRQINGRQPLAS